MGGAGTDSGAGSGGAPAADAGADAGGPGVDAGGGTDAGGASNIDAGGASGVDAGGAPNVDAGGSAPVIKSVSTGEHHACALSAQGDVYCWGDGQFGQLGNGLPYTMTHPTKVPNLKATYVAAGNRQTFAIRTDGTVVGWGANIDGELGIGGTAQADTPVALGTISGAVSVTASGFCSVVGCNQTCTVGATGELWCWGGNQFGQLGNGTKTPATTPFDLGNLGVLYASAGADHTCAVTGSSVLCWGDNMSGQLGDGTVNPELTPVAADINAQGIAGIAAGGNHTCIRYSGTSGCAHCTNGTYGTGNQYGSVWCWGSNAVGQIGDASPLATVSKRTTASRVVEPGPTGLVPLESVRQIAAITGRTCAVLSDRTVSCWGNQSWDGSSTSPCNIPCAVSGLSNVQQIAMADDDFAGAYACVVQTSGQVECWGSNVYGQLGDGTQTTRSTPLPVSWTP